MNSSILSTIYTSLIYSMIEYFSYLNLWLIILFLFLCLFFLIFSSCQLLISSLYCSGAVFEFSLILVSFLFIVIIISPALIILLDYEIIIVPSFIVFICGYQWAWTFSGSLFGLISYLFDSLLSTANPLFSSASFFSLDHYLLSSFYFRCALFSGAFLTLSSAIYSICSLFEPCFELLIALSSVLFSFINSFYFESLFFLVNLIRPFLINSLLLFEQFYIRHLAPNLAFYFLYFKRYIYSNLLFNSFYSSSFYSFIFILFASYNMKSILFYFFNTNSILLLCFLSSLRFIVFSYDVIHSFGLYSFGIKIDAIPGKFNVTSTIRTLIKGEHRGLCYELCGYGHSTMLINSRTL